MKRHVISIITIIFLVSNYTLLEAKTEKNIQDIAYVRSKTNFDIAYMYDFADVKKISGIKVMTWAPMRRVVLRDKDYPSKEKMIEIKNSPKIIADLSLQSNLECSIRLAKFKTYNDSHLAFIDSVPPHTQWQETLFSGETLENSIVITTKNGLDSVAHAYLFYKNCLCCFSFTTCHGKIVENDYLVIDQLIKNIKFLIDKSF